MTTVVQEQERGSVSEYVHVAQKFRHVVGLSDADRLKFLKEPRWVGYQRAQQVLEALSGLMDTPPRPRMPNLLLIGEPNNGKTTIVERFRELYGQGFVDQNNEPVKPVIVAQAPPSPDEVGLYISILERFWAPYNASAKPAKLRIQAVHQLRMSKTRILLLDEFHSLLRGTIAKQQAVMNAIKYMCNETGIPIVGIGTADAVRALHTDPQHASRFDVLQLPLWELDQDFQTLVASFESLLPLKRPSRLHELPIVQMLHDISGGNLGDLHRLLVACAEEAIRKGTEQITVDIVKGKSWLRPTRGIRNVPL